MSSRRHFVRAIATGCAIAFLCLEGLAAAQIEASLSQPSVRTGQAVVLTLRREGTEPLTPDLSPLAGAFRVLDRATTSETQVTNGRRRVQQELRLWLLPERTGTLTVPALGTLGEASEPLTLEVSLATSPEARLLPAAAGTGQGAAQGRASTSRDAEASAEVEVEASASPTRVVIGQQVVLRVLVRSDPALPPGRLIDPTPSSTRLLPLGEERRTTRRGDATLEIFERSYALFPEAAGTLAIAPLRFEAWDTSAAAPRRIESAPLQIEVGERPQTPSWVADDAAWLPARTLTLTEAGATRVRLAPGQAVERMITLRAVGLMAEDLPPIPLAIPFQLRAHDDAPRLWNERRPDGVIGYRAERVLISTAAPGDYVLPSPELPWWNTETKQWERATTPAWELEVAPLDSASRRIAPRWDRDLTAPDARATDEQATGGPEGRFVQAVLSAWPWILVGLLAAGAAIYLGTKRRCRMRVGAAGARPNERPSPDSDASPPGGDSPEAARKDPLAEALTEIDAAYQDGDADRARSALLVWGKLRWPEQPPANLARLAGRLSEPASGRVRLLDTSFFSPRAVAWASEPVAPLLGGDHARGASTVSKSKT